jgi:hypothetical protein
VNAYGELLKILERHGSPMMARHALDSACKRLELPAGTVSNDHLERVIEHTMQSFRVFCNDKARQALWVDLIELLETRR